MSADLVATLESPVPAALEAGRPATLFCAGTCFDPESPLDGVALVVDGARHRPAAARMPRRDLAHLGPHAFRSGFWGTVPVPARAAGEAVEVALSVNASGRPERTLPLARIPVAAREPPPALGRPAPDGLIAVCMATWEPDPDLFAAQVESLRAQTDRRWTCVVSDDCSSPEAFARIEALLGGDPRFAVSRSPQRLGFYRNFERALRLAPAEARLVALCDQDDRWRPEKLEVLRAALGGGTLAYSDQRLVDAHGRVLRETMWRGRRNDHTSLVSMLVANSITGAATLMRRDVADLALPFPDPPGLQFHDHWIGLVALAAGDVAYVDRPLYDYVQHGGAVFGEVSGGGRRRGARGPWRRGRAAYFLGYVPREALAQELLLRCADCLTPPKRRALRRFAAAERSAAGLAWLAARPARALAGRNETLGSELELVHGLVWRRLVALLGRAPAGPWRRLCDTTLPAPTEFDQKRLRRWRARL